MWVLLRAVIIEPVSRTEALAYCKALENVSQNFNPNCRQSEKYGPDTGMANRTHNFALH